MTATATRSVRLGTRPSPMAMEQTTRFAAAFRDRYPDVPLGIVTITSEGDRHRGPLAEIGGKGAFTRRADQRLLDGRVEAAIACAKDLPSAHDRAPGITVAAVLPREDVRDVLVLPENSPPVTLAELPAGTRVGTSAPGELLSCVLSTHTSSRCPSAVTPTAAWPISTTERWAWTR